MKLSIDDSFNDIAVRITSLGTSNDLIKTEISNSNIKLVECKDTIVSTLSDVDQNIINKFNKSIVNIVNKLENNSSSEDIKKSTDKVLEVIQTSLNNEKTIKSLEDEKLKLIQLNLQNENLIANLKTDIESKLNEIKRLNENISKLKVENTELIDGQLIIINDLQQEKSTLLKELEISKTKYSNAVKEYEEKITSANISNKQIEEQNIKIFTEEKKKVTNLIKELENCNRKLSEQKSTNAVAQKELHDSKEFAKSKVEELKNLQSIHESQLDKSNKFKDKFNETNQIINDLNKNIGNLNVEIENKNQVISKLQSAILANESEINELKSKLDDSNEIIKNMVEDNKKADSTPKINNIFPESRTSTVKSESIKEKREKYIKVEKIEKPIVPVTKKSQSKPKRVTKPTIERKEAVKSNPIIKITQPSKRKLLDSSQDSVKESKSLKKRGQEALKNSVLKDLDIFNEFEAIDRLGTIGKPGW